MASDAEQQGLSTLTSAIDRLIRATRRMLRSTWVATGLAVSVGLFITTLLVVAFLDLAVPLWPALRLLGLLLILVPTSWAILTGVVRPLLRRLSQVMVARRIEQELPGIHNRLVSCVDLSRNGDGRTHSQSFHRRLVNEAFERIRDFRPRRVLDLLSLRRAGLFATCSAGVFALAFLLFSDRLPTALARIFQPFADIPPASGVLYDVLVGDQTEPGDYESLRGEDVEFTVVLTRGEVDPPGGSDPLRLDIDVVDENGESRELNYDLAEVRDNRTSFTLTGMQHSFTYRVRGGGTWSREYAVRMLDRPRIVSLQTALHYPEYMRIPEPRIGAPQALDVAGPKESTVEVTVAVEGDASEGEIELLQPRTRLVQVLDRPERVWFTDEVPAGAEQFGDWKDGEALLGQQGHTHGPRGGVREHGFRNAPLGFHVLPGESLFADVYLNPDRMPETVMLKFHDGENWEHRAYWGADTINEGAVDTGSRRYMGELPAGGELVRLEVPADILDLTGRRIHGVNFTTSGGHAVFVSAGSAPPATRRVTELVVTEAVLLRPLPAPESDAPFAERWSGEFRLVQDGFYRVVLRNRLGHANQQMQEGELTAIPDHPPQVAIERPGIDLVVSEPIKVPIHLSAYDDFGIDDIVLSVQTEESGTFQGRPVVEYERPKRSENTVVMLDLAEEDLRQGDTLRYRIVVRDCKGQTATTVDHTIRLADESNAVDRQFARYEEQTETLQEKLEELVAEQTKVTDALEQLTEEYEPLTNEIEEALAEAAADPNQPADQPPQITLDEESQQQLEELRAEIAGITPIEDRAVQLSREIANDLEQMANQSVMQELLPSEVAEQVRGVQEAFEQLAVNPLQELRDSLQAATEPSQPDPQLADARRQSRDVQQTLEDLQTRMEAVAGAQEMSRDDVNQAVAELRQDVLQQNAEMANRDLTELRDFVEAMREELGELGDEQDALMADAEQVTSDRLLERLIEAQSEFDAAAEPVLADARDLLGSDMLEEIRNQAADADATEPEGGEPVQAEDAALAESTPQNLPIEPALSNAQPQPPTPQPAGAGEGEGDPARQALQARQQERAQELDMAEQSLAFDQEVLEDLIESLASQLPANADESLTPEQASQLASLMNAGTTREAMEMFRRLEQMLAGDAPEGPPEESAMAEPLQPAQLSDIGSQEGVVGRVEAILVELDDLDLATRTVIMRMQPREREELLQGLREDGPEGYREFIRDYFQRLTKIHGSEQQ